MNNEKKKSLLYPVNSMIISKKITQEVVEENIKDYAENNRYHLEFSTTHILYYSS